MIGISPGAKKDKNASNYGVKCAMKAGLLTYTALVPPQLLCGVSHGSFPAPFSNSEVIDLVSFRGDDSGSFPPKKHTQI
jgi:hypothetical protein